MGPTLLSYYPPLETKPTVANPVEGSISDELDDIIADVKYLYSTPIISGGSTPESVAYIVREIEKHFHNKERWFGISGDQSGNDWAADTLTPFQDISGNNAYGTDANDEALLFGTDDTPIFIGSAFFDVHRLLVENVSSGTVWKIQIIWGTGTMAAAISAGQYTEVMVQFDTVNPQLSAGIPVDVMMPKLAVDTKLWSRAWNATDNATIDFLLGVHEYDE